MYQISKSFLQIDGVNYYDKLLLMPFDTGYGKTVNMIYDLAFGITGTHAYSWGAISITGGPHSGEKWTLIFRTDMFQLDADIQTFLNQPAVLGVGNYTLDYIYHDPAILSSIDEEGDNRDYSFNLPIPLGAEVIEYAPTSDPPPEIGGFMNYMQPYYKASLTFLRIGDVDYNDRMYFVFATDAADGQRHEHDEDSVPVVNGNESYDWACVSITGGDYAGEKWTLLCATTQIPDSTALQSFLNQNPNVGVGNYTIDYEFLGGDDNVSANGENQEYSFSLPGVAEFANGSYPTDNGYLRHEGGGDIGIRSVDVIYFEECLEFIGEYPPLSVGDNVRLLFVVLTNPRSVFGGEGEGDPNDPFIDKAGYLDWGEFWRWMGDVDYVRAASTSAKMIKKLR